MACKGRCGRGRGGLQGTQAQLDREIGSSATITRAERRAWKLKNHGSRGSGLTANPPQLATGQSGQAPRWRIAATHAPHIGFVRQPGAQRPLLHHPCSSATPGQAGRRGAIRGSVHAGGGETVDCISARIAGGRRVADFFGLFHWGRGRRAAAATSRPPLFKPPLRVGLAELRCGSCLCRLQLPPAPPPHKQPRDSCGGGVEEQGGAGLVRRSPSHALRCVLYRPQEKPASMHMACISHWCRPHNKYARTPAAAASAAATPTAMPAILPALLEPPPAAVALPAGMTGGTKYGVPMSA